MSVHYNYILQSEDGRRTYNGYTTNFVRRLRQHNGDIQGGARSTRGRGPWRFLAIVVPQSQMTKHEALSLEWNVRYPFGRRGRRLFGPEGRILALQEVLPRYKEHRFVVYTDPEWALYLSEEENIDCQDIQGLGF